VGKQLLTPDETLGLWRLCQHTPSPSCWGTYLLLLPQPDQLQHEHVLVTLQRVNLVCHASIVAQLQVQQQAQAVQQQG
jgi:hypothetical protein